MFYHAVLPYESFATNLTRKGLLSCVQTHVSAQVRLVIELFGAHLAFVRFVAGVLCQMLLPRKGKKN